jgi:hypothetical protein
MEKRLVPLEGSPLRVPCGKCKEIFSSVEAKEAHESLRMHRNDPVKIVTEMF